MQPARFVIFGLLTMFLIVSCGSDELSFSDTFSANDVVSDDDSVFTKIGLKSGDQVDGEFRLTLISSGVSSGSVTLNGEDLYSSSDFNNSAFVETIDVTLFEENDISAAINGKPGDQLCVRIFETSDPDDLDEDGDTDDERTIFEDCVDREAGPTNLLEALF